MSTRVPECFHAGPEIVGLMLEGTGPSASVTLVGVVTDVANDRSGCWATVSAALAPDGAAVEAEVEPRDRLFWFPAECVTGWLPLCAERWCTDFAEEASDKCERHRAGEAR